MDANCLRWDFSNSCACLLVSKLGHSYQDESVPTRLASSTREILGFRGSFEIVYKSLIQTTAPSDFCARF